MYQISTRESHIILSRLRYVIKHKHALLRWWCMMLVMFDLSAAFDTIDHQITWIIVQRMKDIFGVQGDALKWVASYLTERYQVVNIDGHISSSAQLLYGVPQISVMGPKKYTMYTKPLGEIIRKHGLGYHIYADDTQLYIAFKGDDENRKCLNTMEACLLDVQKWMAANLLKLNNDKTEVVLFAPKQITVSTRNISVAVGNTHVSAITSVRNLGVMLDTTLSMDDQVKAVCRTAYAQLRGIGHIRRYLTTDAAKKVVNSLVTTRLDYCNSLLYGIPGRLLARLQKVQSTAARIVSRTSRYAHITPVLHELHWLPIESRLKYKVLLMAHRALHGSAPQYMCTWPICWPYTNLDDHLGHRVQHDLWYPKVERSHMEIDASPGQPRSCGTPYPPTYRTQTRSAPSRQHLKVCSVNVILVKYLLASFFKLFIFLYHVNLIFLPLMSVIVQAPSNMLHDEGAY